MINLKLPGWVAHLLKQPTRLNDFSGVEIDALKNKLSRLNAATPLVSVIIPAWNEEEGILHTLISLANSVILYPTELIVVDNNSTDGTVKLLEQLGIKTLLQIKQGVGHARTCGLGNAKGKYVLTGDSDTLYSPHWINSMTKALIKGESENVYCVHGSYSFLPGINTPRWQYGLYEGMSSFIIKRKEQTQPFLNVLGFNCGFIRKNGIAVNGYEIEIQRTFRGIAGEKNCPATEDGMMALRLQESGGKIKAVYGNGARVWTSDRRIQIDGGIRKALLLRIKKHVFKN